MHHQRHPPADRADHRAPGHRPAGHRVQVQPVRRAAARAGAAGLRDHALAPAGLTMIRIPILQMGQNLLVTIQVDMQDQMALALQDDLANKISLTGAKGVLIDISALEIVDSFVGRMLASISGISRILDATTVVVGMQPAVAITLVELGLSLTGVRTALNVERGMELLRQLRGTSAEAGDDHQEA